MHALFFWLLFSLVVVAITAVCVWFTRALTRANARDLDSYGVEIDR